MFLFFIIFFHLNNFPVELDSEQTITVIVTEKDKNNYYNNAFLITK